MKKKTKNYILLESIKYIYYSRNQFKKECKKNIINQSD